MQSADPEVPRLLVDLGASMDTWMHEQGLKLAKPLTLKATWMGGHWLIQDGIVSFCGQAPTLELAVRDYLRAVGEAWEGMMEDALHERPMADRLRELGQYVGLCSAASEKHTAGARRA